MKHTLTGLCLLLCFVCKAQTTFLSDTLDKPFFTSLDGGSFCDIKTKRVQSMWYGKVYSIWNYKPVPQKGIYVDTCIYLSPDHHDDIMFWVFYDGVPVVRTTFIQNSKWYWSATIDSGFIKEHIR